MATIDNLDISIYDLYARREILVQEINQQLRLEEAGNIPPQTNVLSLNPELSQLDILLGVVALHTPWAHFFPPKSKLRRSPFVAHRVASTLGSLEDQAALFEYIEAIPCGSPEEEEKKHKILSCFKELDKLNEWMGFIFGRKGQFLQG